MPKIFSFFILVHFFYFLSSLAQEVAAEKGRSKKRNPI